MNKEPDHIIRNSYVYSFSQDMPCAAKVKPDSTVAFCTLDCFGGQIKNVEDTCESIDWERINPATGALFVEGAQKGDALAVRILSIKVDSPGIMVTVPGAGAIPDLVGMSTSVVPIKNGLVHLHPEVMLELSPMVGVIGVAPPSGSIPTGTPGTHGGNLDTKVIGAGSTVYLPVSVEGAKLAMGDLHAIMGDGEVSVCGVEVSGKVVAEISVLKGVSLQSPVIETDESYYILWSHESMDEAAKELTALCAETVSKTMGCTIEEGISLLSAGGNLQISQIVDPLKTLRFEIPKTLLGHRPLLG